jgi:NAD(P)H-hydrate epimerase
VVDGLLGTGFSGTVQGDYRDAIEAINKSEAFVISVDINSGMNGDSGEAELAVRSDLTVTIGFVKTGLVTENAGYYIKRLVCADIGIVLIEEEGFITENTCPPWLDMNVIMSR